MKTREEIKALSFEEADKIENEVLEAIDDNDLAKVKDILKDYPVEISCYELNIKNDKDAEFPLCSPYILILRAASSCEEHNNDFSILDYLFNEYGLSLKDPKYNFFHSDMKYIKEINEKYILLEKVKLTINREALIYKYLEEADNPNPEIMKYLVDKGARFDIYVGELEDIPRTPLHFWARTNDYRSLEVAIKGGANVDMPELSRREYPDTLLFYAVSESANYRTTQLLIELGANVNYATPETPLDIAKGTRNKKLLKEAGAMTAHGIDKKFKIPPYKFSGNNDNLGKELDELSKMRNDAIKEAKNGK